GCLKVFKDNLKNKKMRTRGVHFIVGTLTLMLFIVSGQYMGLRYGGFSTPELYGHNEAVRYLHRANHIYLLLPALTNLLLSGYLTLALNRTRRMLQYIGSVLLIISPVLLTAAFLLEPPQPSPERPWTFYGIIAVFGGALLHLRLPRKE
ncbi:MAG TPA: hypothetical protein VGL10_00935, partial [Gammaproteobacteria bacterium]